MAETALATAPVVQPEKKKLLEMMAGQYNLDANAFKDVLLKTVFPQDKPATVEQLASFCAVAHEYKLNPLVREIYAFPSKGGGIVPIVSIDGWITIVQRQPMYDGHRFVPEWKDSKVGGEMVSVTCEIYRKDRGQPISMTEYMEECKRPTEPWNKWPKRMLQHKAFIQCARYAFGLSGIYDEDEAQRIIEAEAVPVRVQANISMPKRIETAPTIVAEPIKPSPAPEVAQAEPAVEQAPFSPFEEQEATPEVAPEPAADELRPIGRGKAQRLYAIMTKHKKHTEAELRARYLAPLHLEHFSDLPESLYEEAVEYAEGKDING